MNKKGKKSKGRDVNGVLLLNKPAGITSNDALQQVKRLFQAAKAGHTGSLDRPATGMLPICFGEATKFTGYLLDADKHYRACCQAGSETSTGDAEGEITATSDSPLPDGSIIEAVLQEFTGEILQVPPMYSALKQNGERLYRLAYQGIEVERQPRPVTIHSIRLLSVEGDRFEIAVHCSKGTYIRTLVEDIGRRLGCGAHVLTLVRHAVAGYREAQMVTMEQLRALAETGMAALDAVLLPVDTAITEIPPVTLNETLSFYLCQGQPVLVPQAPTSGLLRIYNQNNDFLGVGEVLDDGRVAPRRLIRVQEQAEEA